VAVVVRASQRTASARECLFTWALADPDVELGSCSVLELHGIVVPSAQDAIRRGAIANDARGERVYQADGTRARRTCSLVRSRARWCRSYLALSPMQDRARYARHTHTHTHTHTHNDGPRTLKRRQLTIRCVATCACVCVCAMSSGTKPLSLLDRLQQRRSTISLCGPYIMRKPRRGRGVRLYLLSPLSTLACLCSLSLSPP